MYLLIAVFGGIGSYVPVFFGADGFSALSVLGGFIGSIFGLYAAYKMSFG